MTIQDQDMSCKFYDYSFVTLCVVVGITYMYHDVIICSRKTSSLHTLS
jgi:hypothetical protein